MGDTSSRGRAIDVARVLEAHNGLDTRVIDLRGEAGWTDFFVITTVSGARHLHGVVRHLLEFLDSVGIVPRTRPRRSADVGWIVVDCGEFVIHLMDQERRKFYDLETLWFTGVPIAHSSKSS